MGWAGATLIDDAHARGRGIVFLTPHLGSFEVTAQAYAERYAAEHGPITVLYRPARKPWLRDLVDTARGRPGLAAAPATLAGVRQMIRALRRGEAVGLLPDQVPPEGLGVWAPFFGKPAYTMTLAARLVQQTGATLLLAWGERLPAGRRLRGSRLGAGRGAADRGCRSAGHADRLRQHREPGDGGADPAMPAAIPVGLQPLQDPARRGRPAR